MNIFEFLLNLLIEQGVINSGEHKKLSLAITSTLAIVLFRFGLQSLTTLKDWLAGRSLVVKRDAGIGLLNKILMAVIFVTPWLRLFSRPLDIHISKGLVQATLTCGAAAWIALRASGATSAWLDQDEEVVRARRGWNWLGPKELEVRVTRLFCDHSGRHPTSIEQLKVGRWDISPDVLQMFTLYRGSEFKARRFLNAVLAQQGGTPKAANRH
ncbi:MAG TPA: hypothetical protein DCQ06_01345 [Myxococcales bacterium]|nr:hypothetical protein [Myxococcales bacterium]